MAAGGASLWSNRRAVAEAAGLLMIAHILVKTVSLGRLRSLLAARAAVPANAAYDARAARMVGRRVDRAAMRLPLRTKCLARAVTTFWLLARRRLAARLVIAVHRHDRSGEHAFHAWVEHGDEIVIGHCDRGEYAAVMTLGGGADGG